MLKNFVVLILILYPVMAFIDWELWESTMSKNITKGISLAPFRGMFTKMSGPESVVCGIVIQNWTKWTLLDPIAKTEYGSISKKPRDVLPGQMEALVAVKSADSTAGTMGSASWLLGDKQMRVVVTWSVPYTFDMYTNWLAVGITKEGVTTHKSSWTDAMYYEYPEDVTELGFRRERYYSSSETIIYKGSDIEITGKMGKSHKPEVLVVVRPLLAENLADSLRKTMFGNNELILQ